MPCDDVTEVLRLRLDKEDRLAGYQLIKRTCGRAVGEQSLLEEEFCGQAPSALLAMDADTFADAHPVDSDTEMFLQLKHYFAVQSGLQALLGFQAAGKDDPVKVARVVYEGEEVVLEAELSVDIITEQIKSCGRCSGCGVKQKLKERTAL